MPGLAELGLGLIELGAAAIDDRDVVGARQVGLSLRQLRAGALNRGAVLLLLDHEEPLTLLDLRAFAEPHLLEHAGDASPDLDGRHRLGAGHELAQDRRIPLHHLRDHDGRRDRWGRRLGTSRAITAGDEQPRAEHDRKEGPQPEVAHRSPLITPLLRWRARCFTRGPDVSSPGADRTIGPWSQEREGSTPSILGSGSWRRLRTARRTASRRISWSKGLAMKSTAPAVIACRAIDASP